MTSPHPIGRCVSALTVVVVCGGLLMAFGCNSKVSDCNKVIDVVNAHANDGDALKFDNADDWEAAAKLFDKAATDIKAVAVKDDQVKSKAAAIADTDAKAAAAFRDVGKTAKGGDPEGAAKGQKSLEEIKTSRAKAIDDFETYCKS